MTINESIVEQATINWLQELGYIYKRTSDLLRGNASDYAQVILLEELQAALASINPNIPADALQDALRKATNSASQDMLEDNLLFHRMLVDGIDVEYNRPDGSIQGDKVWLIDFVNPKNNHFMVVNQFTIIENKQTRRPDLVIFVNGLPLAVIELKSPTDENATIAGAYNQLQTYKKEIASLFRTNALLVISDGIEARAGSLTANRERFLPWRTMDGINIAPKGSLELETLIKGMFDPHVFLDLIQNFIVFEVDSGRVIKKIAAYHQYWAVKKAVECTVKASSSNGNKRAGVIWHTQGSGKSLSMAFYAGKIIKQQSMQNPTLVVLTDRNDLDDQLFSTFSSCEDLFRQAPKQAKDRKHLRELLAVASGGVIFTTIQKFAPEKGESYPLLSDRRNIIVIADEAHRSQYDFIDGFARHMRDGLPQASFIGFTGTPIELSDKDTYAVFGENIHTYDIQQAVEDGATVRIYYESRLAKIELNREERPHIDEAFEEVTEGEEMYRKDKLKSKWARLEALVGSEKRVALIAKDIVEHFENRRKGMESLIGEGGKGMIVCMSRRVCVELYNAIIKLRPEWHSDDDDKGFVKIVMTGDASDPESFQPHIRNKFGRDNMVKRAKDENDSLKLVIVRDMWLTGFDAPCLHTMYVDKPMHGHGLMQAITRVNRVFKNKPGGLIVDYLGIADSLKKALSNYTENDRSEAGVPQEDAIALLLEKYEIMKEIWHGFNYSAAIASSPADQLRIIPAALDYLLSQENGRDRFMKSCLALSKAFALAAASDEAIKIRDDIGFFQKIRSALAKSTVSNGKDVEDLDIAVQQLVSRAVSSMEIVDIFAAAGLKTADISILSDEFLTEVRGMEKKNLALEMLKKMLRDEITNKSKKNIVQARHFSEMLENTLKKYQVRSVEATQIIEELIKIAQEMKLAKNRGEELGLNDDEDAFYDALAENMSARNVLGDDQLRQIARELVQSVKSSATIDWKVKESVRATIRLTVKKILRKYGYPPDLQEKAIQTVLEQAEIISEGWIG